MSQEQTIHHQASTHGPKAQLVQKYFQVQVETSPPDEILLMLLDGAVRFAESALEATDKKDLEKKNAQLLKAQAIVMELNNSLQADVGEQVLRNLRGLYFFIYQKFVEGNVRNDKNLINEGLKMLLSVRETWRQAVAQYRQAVQLQSPKTDQLVGAGQGLSITG